MRGIARTAVLAGALLAHAAATPAVDVILEPVVGGLTRPVVVTHAGDARLFVVEKNGYVRIVDGGSLLPAPFLDIHTLVSTGNEQGLLGLAFHPDYADNGFFYVHYTDTGGDTRVMRYAVSGDPDLADAGSATPVLSVDQPFANHNGGDLHFGPDGYLYVSLGDGGSFCDPGDEAQDGASLLGKILRLDVDGGSPYAIPPGNPFVGPDGVADEIWAVGLRNPWRMSFDRLTGDLWIGDVGQNAREEIDRQPAASTGGENYGWDCREGFAAAAAPPSNCGTTATCMPLTLFTEPVADYSHASGCSVTGGFRYRGSDFPALAGIYIFSDYCNGELRGLSTADGGLTWDAQSLRPADGSLLPTAFGEDVDGEVYVASDGGTIYRLAVAAAPAVCPPAPASGCLSPGKAKLIAKQPGDPSKNKLLWKWIKGPALDQADFGVPTAATGYTLCVYAGTTAVDLGAVVAAGSGWAPIGTSGYKFKDAAAGGDGVFKVTMKGGAAGKSKVLLKAKGANLDLSALPLGLGSQPLVTQLLRNDDATCWEATFASVASDSGSLLKAKTP